MFPGPQSTQRRRLHFDAAFPGIFGQRSGGAQAIDHRLEPVAVQPRRQLDQLALGPAHIERADQKDDFQRRRAGNAGVGRHSQQELVAA